MAPYFGKVTIEHPKIWWETRRRSKEPCDDIPFVVFFKFPHGWICLVTTLSVNFDRYDCEVVHWTPTTFVCGFSLEIVFLTHFQLPIRYETGTDLLTSLRQNTSTHIYDHIHKWRRWRRFINAHIIDQLLADWFTKSLLPPIAWDVAMGGAITKEQDISQA